MVQAQTIETLKKELANANASLNHLTAQARADNKLWQEEKAAAQEQCQRAEERVHQLTQQVDAEIARVAQLEKNRALHEAETKAAHEAEVTKLEETVRQLKLSAEGYKKDMCKKLKGMESEMATIRGTSRLEIDRLQRELNALVEKADLYEKKAHTADESLRASENTIKDLRAEHAKMLAALKKAQKSAGNVEAERSSELAAAKAHYNAELAALKEELKRVPLLEDMLATTKNDLAVEASKAVRFERAATAAEEALHTTKRDLQKLLDERSDECGRLKSRLAELEGKFAHLEKNNANLQKQIDTAPSVEDLAEARQTAQDANCKVEQLESQLAGERRIAGEKDVGRAHSCPHCLILHDVSSST